MSYSQTPSVNGCQCSEAAMIHVVRNYVSKTVLQLKPASQLTKNIQNVRLKGKIILVTGRGGP
jgi:hypothetical protein